MGDGPYRRFVAWTKDRAPPLHRFLTSESSAARWGRSIAGTGLIVALGVLLLWGGTGQPLGQPPVVVIESGSMMQCEQGPGTHSSVCGSTSFGRLGTIDPGDLVFVRDVDDRDDVKTLAQGGKERHGMAGDVIVYDRAAGAPIIHRAMFWVDIHENGRYSIPELGIFNKSSTDQPELRDQARWGKGINSCTLRLPTGDGPEASGFVTKGDNNVCWDQGSCLDRECRPNLIDPSEIIGKARGEIPWIGLLKLFVFDLFGGGASLYAAAPADLKRLMWVSVALIVGGPYIGEQIVKRRRAAKAPADDGDESE